MQKRFTQIERTKYILQKSTYVTVTRARMVELAMNLPGSMNVSVKLEQLESTVRQVGEICVHIIHIVMCQQICNQVIYFISYASIPAYAVD